MVYEWFHSIHKEEVEANGIHILCVLLVVVGGMCCNVYENLLGDDSCSAAACVARCWLVVRRCVVIVVH